MHIGTTLAVALTGLDTSTVNIQGFISSGLPYFSIIGLPDVALSQARERVKSSCKAIGIHWPSSRVTVNLSPASLPKRGSCFDLSIVACVLSAMQCVNAAVVSQSIIMGELALDGTVLPIHGILPIMLHAQRNNIERVFLPYDNCTEARMVGDVQVVGVRHLVDLLNVLGAPESMLCATRTKVQQTARNASLTQATSPEANVSTAITNGTKAAIESHNDLVDIADITGQDDAKWALEVAAAGGHHTLMIGPPGAGKSMLARCLPTLLPSLSIHEQIELACIRSTYSVVSAQDIRAYPPFEILPSHATVADLIGSAKTSPTPGALTRAHGGVLFLDEATEFDRKVIQALRLPLETQNVILTRKRNTTVHFPAKCQLVLAHNPCPCGNFGIPQSSPETICTCTSLERRRYNQKISQPIKDRIDIKIFVPNVSHMRKRQKSTISCSALSGTYEERTSAQIRERVTQARSIARERYEHYPWNTNAQAGLPWLMDNTPTRIHVALEKLLDSSTLTMRGAQKVLRISWTLADLAGRTTPHDDDIDMALALYLSDM